MKKIKILIPPSEGKLSGGKYEKLSTISDITKILINGINSYKDDLSKLYGVTGKALEKAIRTNKNILSSMTLPAIERYSGVVYKAIDYNSIENKNLFDERVLILSALFGLLSPKEKIPDYKLKINKLDTTKLWKDELKGKLDDFFVIDLLPKTHRKVISYKDGIAVDFFITKNNIKKPSGHNGKYIKGRFVRWLIENDIRSPDEFHKFSEDGYIYNNATKSFIKYL